MKRSFKPLRPPNRKAKQDLKTQLISAKLVDSDGSINDASFSIDKRLFTLANLSIDSISSDSQPEHRTLKKNGESFSHDVEQIKLHDTPKLQIKRRQSRINCLEPSDASCCLQWHEVVKNSRQVDMHSMDEIFGFLDDGP